MRNIKAVSFILFFLFGLGSELQAQWTRLSVSADQRLNAVHFIDSAHGYAVGGNQTLLKSTDSGASWSATHQGQSGTEELKAVYFVNTSLGFAAGGTGLTGIILRTEDGGASLDTVAEVSDMNYFNDLQMINADTGYVVGGKGRIFKTINGGTLWNIIPSDTVQNFHGLHFLDVDTGYVCGNNGVIMKTTDGGISWTFLNTGNMENYYDVRFTDTKNGVIVGYGGIIMHTDDGGNTWSDVTIDNAVPIECVHFGTSNTGYAVTHLGGIYKTVTGGKTWFKSRNYVPGLEDLWGIHAIDDKIVVLVGEVDQVNFNSTIMRTTNGGGTAPPTGIEEAVSLSPEIQIHPNPASDFFILNTNGKKDVRFSLVNLQGETVYSSSVVSRDQKISVKHFQAGMYIAVVEDGGEVFRERVVVK